MNNNFFQKTLSAIAVSLAMAFNFVESPTLAADLVVRKNVVDLNPQEKLDFVNALKTLKTTIPEGSQISIYDQFVATHVATMGFMSMAPEDPSEHNHVPHAHGPAAGTSPAHGSAAFLPWHREFTRRFEEALQSVNPNVTIPYWDWTNQIAIDVIFQPDFLGTKGEGSIDIPGVGIVQGGAVAGNFSAASGWVLNNDFNLDFSGNPRGTALTRFMQVPPLDSYPIPKTEVDQVLALDNYSDFQPALEGTLKLDNQNGIPGFLMHNYIHGMVGGSIPQLDQNPPFYGLGTMSFLSSPYDPVFWLHHANVDRLWAEWQDNGHTGSAFYPATDQAFGSNLNDPMWPWDGGLSTPMNMGPGNLLSYLPSLATNDVVKPTDVLDFRQLGYKYDTTIASVPEPGLTLGLFGLAALGTGSLLKRKYKQKIFIQES